MRGVTAADFTQRNMRLAVVLASIMPLALLAQAGCRDVPHAAIADEITIVVRRDDALVARAARRLVGFGRKAIPQIETALHTAPARGRLALVGVLGTIGDRDAAPILRHLARHDDDAAVRAAGERLLQSWGAPR
jgi:hypothetical protein